MSDIKFKRILELCLSIETGAAKLYASFSEQSEVDEHKIFWEDICEDEKRHIAYWEELIELEQEGSLRNPFDRPDNIKAELEATKCQVDYIINKNEKSNDISNRMIYTFRIESMMLHPAFAFLFSSLKNENRYKSPYNDYHDHLEKFSHFIHKFLSNSAEMLFICEILSKMWDRNIELANQFAQIKMLHGFLPICAKCKKIRDDKGFWNQIESYISAHSDAIFSHGLCPNCAEKLYPEFSRKP
jgi:hypothetical protein